MTTVVSLALLGLVALAAVSIVASTMRLGISPLPTSGKVRRAMLSLVPPHTRGEVHELGCGFGGLALALARHCPGARVIAWEASWVPFLVAFVRARRVPNLEVRCADFRRADLSRGDTLVCYLFTGGMRALAQRLLAERPGAPLCLVTNTFSMHGWAPAKVITVDDLWRTKVYRYDRVPDMPGAAPP